MIIKTLDNMNIQLVTSIENKVNEIAAKHNLTTETINIEYMPSSQYGTEEDECTNETYVWTVYVKTSTVSKKDVMNFMGEVQGECSIDEELNVFIEVDNFDLFFEN